MATATKTKEALKIPVCEDKRTPQTYDFENPEIKEKWTRGISEEGSLNIVGHSHICALWTITQGFKASSYQIRQMGMGVPRHDYYGNPIPAYPKRTIDQIMVMDMDYIMSAISSSENTIPVTIEVWTNGQEYQPWLDFIARCPYAYKMYTIPSRMGKYDVTCWLFTKGKDPRP